MTDLNDYKSLVSPAVPHLLDSIIVRGEGAYVWDKDGRRYLDFTSGIGVTNTGHCHPRVVAAIREQAELLLHLQQNIAYHEPMLRLLAAVREVVPPELNTFFFANCGAEAVESAIKLSRQVTGRTNIIVFERGFHGRTIGAMSLTASKIVFRNGYQPLMPGVFIAPYAYCYRCPKAEANPEEYGFDKDCDCWMLEQLRFLLKSQTAPEETAAMVVEPVLGEGGYVVPPVSFLRGLRQICDEHGILLIMDEIQSGFGRTGRYFAFEHFNIIPDILVMAKGLASGMPLSAIATRSELFKNSPPGSHGGTYGGNIVACAAAEASIRVYVEEKLAENATRLGKKLLAELNVLKKRFQSIGDVRGLGLMIGVEFVKTDNHIPDKDKAKAVQKACLEEGLIILTCGTDDNVIRWIPPLIIDENHLNEALGIFEHALEKIA